MIVKKESYTPEEVEQLLKWQFIATRNAIQRTEPWRVNDHHERIQFVDVFNAVRDVKFEECRIDMSSYEYDFTPYNERP